MAHPVVMPEFAQQMPPQAHMAGHQAQPGHPPIPPHPNFHAVMNQGPPDYVGCYIKPITLQDGRRSWQHVQTLGMNDSQAKLAEFVERDPNKNKIKEALNHKYLNDIKRRPIQDFLNYHNSQGRNHGISWRLASIKVSHEKTADSTVKNQNKVFVTSIRVILKKISPNIRRQSISFPTPRPNVADFLLGQQGLPRGVPNAQAAAIPTVHHAFGAPPEVRRQPQLPPEMTVLPMGDTDSDDDDDDYEDHKAQTKNVKNDKDEKKEKSPKIYIPNNSTHERSNSKASSRPSSRGGSDGFSVIDSPITSVSSSPRFGGWSGMKRAPERPKKYYDSKRSSKASLGAHSNDSFVVIPSQSQRGSHKQKDSMNSLNELSRDPIKYRRESDHFDSQILARMEKLKLEEYEKKRQERQQLEHNLDVMDRLNAIDDKIHHMISREDRDIAPRIHQASRELAPRLQQAGRDLDPRYYQGSRDMGYREPRPYDRSYSDDYVVGYTASRQRNRSSFSYR